jgi:hypothetical protein
MNWASKHPVEVVAEWCAPSLVAVAAGWAASIAGLPLVAVAAASVMALAGGVVTMRLAGGASIIAEPIFEPVAFEDAVAEDVLLLDDPLIEIDADARVVQLFAKAEPTPGELVLRIEDYLSDGRRAPAPEGSAADRHPVDASAALHAALANIRASLR